MRATKPVTVLACALLLVLVASAAWEMQRKTMEAPADLSAYRLIRWFDLVPKDWDQFKRLRSMKLATLRDGDPKAHELLEEVRSAWDKAPTVNALDGSAVRMVGYLVPLEGDAQGLSEFLLVPYEGACIHTPPPPANQVLHVVLARRAEGFRLMDHVAVRGILSVRREQTLQAVSGYLISHAEVDKYIAPSNAR